MSLREDLPYRAEYAKSSRAACKKCQQTIAKDSVRLAVMVQSRFFDGKQPNWHHFECFFQRYRPKVEEISHFANLKYNDQKLVEEAIKTSIGAPNGESNSGTKKKSRKKKATEGEAISSVTEYSDFKIEYSKSSRAKCRLCDNTITKDTIRISRLDRDSEDARRFGPLDRWFHVECFVSGRDTLGFFGSAENLPFFDKLEEVDRKDLIKKLPQMKRPDIKTDVTNESSESPPKKQKLSKSDDQKLKKQSNLLFKYQKLGEEMKKTDLIELLEYNKIDIPSDNHSKYERLADAMAFGVLEKCPECKKGQLVFRISGYICTGSITKWTACEYQTTDTPKRKPFKIPKELTQKYDELKEYKFKEGVRFYNPVLKQAVENASTSASTSTAVFPKKESNESVPLLNGYKISSVGKLKTTKAKLKSILKTFGADFVDTIDRTTLCIVSTKTEFNKESDKIIEAKELMVPIVSEEFLVAIEKGSDPIQAISFNRLDNFEVDVEKRFNNLNVKEKMKSAFKSGAKSGSGFEKSVGKQKMILKAGNVVDPDCEVANVAHIHKVGKDVYNAVLSKVDLTKNKNSYYKLQLLKHDTKPHIYYVFRSWGRVGTTIGGTSLDKFKEENDAINAFEEFYEERTQNEWCNRKKFKKHPNSYYPVDIDYGGDQQISKLDSEKSGSSLPKPVQDLICMIFDVQKMKEQMLEFELDLDKMPLGKLSKQQLLKAFSVLKELSQLIETKPLNQTKIKDATNRFYTMIPHNFGTDRPPLIDNEETIKSKMDMLDTLLDIEMAYDMINTKDETNKNLDPIDHHYQQLNASIEPLSKEEEEFSIIEKYLKNTHGSTHNFGLEIQEVFKVERKGEFERYNKYKDIDNRLLLWHGSRVTNFAGIISQGLRIAPPEAPVTGYMFGKGIYFADMVTKSAGYCHHHSNKNIGLLLLSEVAVGETWELSDAKDVQKLPKGKHSVKGVGKTSPDPNEIHVLPNGAKVPIGKGVDKSSTKCSLLYNEYIVYDVNQVNIKYLLKCKFNTKSLF